MKVCFFGLGSIGKRHLKNFANICKNKMIDVEVHAFRSSNNELDDEIKNLVDKEIFKKADLCNDYDVVFINNPTSMHYETIKFMSNKCKNMFIEKPVFDKKYYRIDELNLNKKGVYYVACPLRYSNVVKYLKDNIDIDKVYSVRAICSSYLPDWRPGIDYRNNYSSFKKQGGGVSMDLIHEWDYITYIFGFPKNIFNLKGKFSHLEIDSDDLSIYIAEYSDKLVELHLDYFGRNSKREIEIYTEKGCIKGDFINEKITTDFSNDIVFNSTDKNYIYKSEMEYFVNLILDNSYVDSNLEYAFKLINILN